MMLLRLHSSLDSWPRWASLWAPLIFFQGRTAPAERPTNRCPPERVSCILSKMQCYIGAYLNPRRLSLTAPAYTMYLKQYNSDRLPQSSTGSSLPTKGLWPIHHKSRFAGFKFGTLGKSLSHSCRSSIKRQGITLPPSLMDFSRRKILLYELA